MKYGVYYSPAFTRRKRLVRTFITKEDATKYRDKKNNSLSDFVKGLGAGYSLKELPQKDMKKYNKYI